MIVQEKNIVVFGSIYIVIYSNIILAKIEFFIKKLKKLKKIDFIIVYQHIEYFIIDNKQNGNT